VTSTAEAGSPLPATSREFRDAFAGLMLALTLAALDQNIVGTALPRIVSDLGGLAHLSWVVTAFLLASTVTTPLYGKLSDLYGRRPLFLVAITVFLLGSVLCGLARTMTELIFFRGIQGLGAGGLITLAQTTIADLVAPRERGRYQGIFSAVFTLASIAGPLLGGLITDTLSWRWIFYLNLPVGIPALVLIAIGLPRSSRVVSHRIDYAGAALLAAGTTCLLLVLSWGGSVYPWSSPAILTLGLAAAVLFVLLAGCERHAAEPVLPPHLFRNRVFVIAAGVLGLSSMALLSAVVFLPLYFQLVLGATPTHAGLMIAPLMLGAITASIAGGRLTSTTGHYKIIALVGLAGATGAYLALAWAAASGAGAVVFEAALVSLGLGLGLVMPTLTVAIQNAVEPRHMGVATSAASFFRALGSALGVAVSGAIMTAQLHRLLPAAWMSPEADGLGPLDQGLEQIAKLPSAQREALALAYRDAIAATFLAGTVFAAVALVVVLLLPELPLKSALATAAETPPQPGDVSEAVESVWEE